jgi:hypothetical protein
VKWATATVPLTPFYDMAFCIAANRYWPKPEEPPPRKNLAIVWLGRIARSFLPVPLFDFMGYAAEQTGRMGCLFGALQSLLAPVSSSLCLQDIVPQGSLGTICRGKAVKGVIKVTLLILLLVFPQFAL